MTSKIPSYSSSLPPLTSPSPSPASTAVARAGDVGDSGLKTWLIVGGVGVALLAGYWFFFSSKSSSPKRSTHHETKNTRRPEDVLSTPSNVPSLPSSSLPRPEGDSSRDISGRQSADANLEKALQAVKDKFYIPKDKLLTLIDKFTEEMHLGLKHPVEEGKSSIGMICSHVSTLPTGAEVGAYYALDLGGTNFRVIRVELQGYGQVKFGAQKAFKIPQEIMTGSAVQLFDFLANACAEVMDINHESHIGDKKIGFTFSFPVKQEAINHGLLIKWTKGFTTLGVENENVAHLLQSTFDRRGYKAKVVALVNDTVGTLAAQAYADQSCQMGVILGTGSNACYVEKIENIPKWTAPAPASGKMVINMEWGNFDSNKKEALPYTEYDRQVDHESVNPGNQLYEKMLSGMYLGEITRLVILKLMRDGILFQGQGVPNLGTKHYFDTSFNSRLATDTSPELLDIGEYLTNTVKVKAVYKERKALQQIGHWVVERAARLSVVGIAAVLKQMGKVRGATVAIDGSVFQHYPGFEYLMRGGLRDIFGAEIEESIKLVLTKDGSGKGAALIASVAEVM